MTAHFIRGEVISFKDDPFRCGSESALVHEEDGLICIEDGKIKAFGSYSDLKSTIPADAAVTHYKDSIICPGFIDGHVHYPQIQMIRGHQCRRPKAPIPGIRAARSGTHQETPA